jgi:SAM-dependent methyltransferase
MAARDLIRKIPGAHAAAQLVSPERRRAAAQWRRISKIVDSNTVLTGPFAGMELKGHSEVSMVLGCYEQELHPLIESWSGYDRVLDVGCAQGWYVVGLARRMPAADVWGFDILEDARSQCRARAAANGVEVNVDREVTAAQLGSLVSGRTLVIMDIEGAEVDILDPDQGCGLKSADILVEMHDFLRPGATDLVRDRFEGRSITTIKTALRDSVVFPVLEALSPADRALAVSDNRPPGSNQSWLWMPAP